MQYLPRNQQKTIQTHTCGQLLEVISQKDIPYGIALSVNIQPTKAHRNTQSIKSYWILEGWIEVEIFNIKTTQKQTIHLQEGDIITFWPNDKHRIINTSKINKLVTIKSPSWVVFDEVEEK